MQNIAFTVAIALLGLGGLLNLIVLAFFAWRVARSLFSIRHRPTGGAQAKLAAAHR